MSWWALSCRPKTSFSFSSAGTSAWNRSTAVLIRSAVEAIWLGAPHLDLVPLQQLLADHHALDLRGPLADQQQRRVAVEALDLVLLRVAVAAVDAEAFFDAVLAGLRGEELGHPGLEVGALAGVLHPRRFAGDEAGGLELGRHVGELELDRLVGGDRLAEGLPFLAVAEGELERPLADADAAGGDVDAADLERVHHLHEALAEAGLLAAEDALGRAAVAVVDQLGRLDALVAHLLDLRRHVQALEVALAGFGPGLLLGDEAGHPLVRRVGLGVVLHQHEDDAGAEAVGDPHLLAVQLPVAVLALLGGRLDALDVGADLGLGEREGGADLAGRHLRQEVILLLVGAELHQQVGADEVGVDDAGDRDPAARELFDDHRVGGQVEPHAAVLLGNGDPEEAELFHLLDDRLREGILVVVVLGVGDDLLVGELADHFDDGFLLVGHFAVSGGVYGHCSCFGRDGSSDQRGSAAAAALWRAKDIDAGAIPGSTARSGAAAFSSISSYSRSGSEPRTIAPPAPTEPRPPARTMARIATERSAAPPRPNQPIAPE